MDWNDPEQVREYNRQYHAKHKQRLAEKAAKWRSDNPGHILESKKRYAQENHEHIAETKRKYKEKTKDKWQAYFKARYEAKREVILARHKKYYQERKERIKKAAHRYHHSHLEACHKRHSQYQRDNRAKLTASGSARTRNYRARKRNAEGFHTTADIKKLWERQCHKCAVPNCPHPITDHRPHKYHVDHITAIKNGGSNWPTNLQILCRHHNVEKWASDEYEWAQRQLGKLFV